MWTLTSLSVDEILLPWVSAKTDDSGLLAL